MAGTGRKWLIGCGIGCGLFIVILGGVGTCGYFAVKDVSERAENMDEGFEILTDLYGKPGDYRPPVDGFVGDGRLEVFLAVREDLSVTSDGLAKVLTDLDAGGGVIAKIKAGMTLVPRLFDYIEDRNGVLAERGMGLGEYLYVYSTVYYSWLGMDPADGPGFVLSDDEEDGENSNVRWSSDWGDDPEDVKDNRRRSVRRYLHGVQRAMVRNQFTDAVNGGADQDWVDALRAEGEAMDGRNERLLWENGLPSAVLTGYEPWRERMEASYSPVMNAVEVALVKHR